MNFEKKAEFKCFPKIPRVSLSFPSWEYTAVLKQTFKESLCEIQNLNTRLQKYEA